MTSKQLTRINSSLEIIKKSLINYVIYKALPVGHLSRRSTGTYKKIAPGKWVKVKDRTMEKDPYANLPKDLKQLPKRQENAIVNSLKKEFNSNELKKRSKDIDKLIKEKEKAFKKTVKKLTKHGIDPAKIKNVELDNLKRAKAMHQKAIANIKR
ncbi:MAG: hypothetical protein ACM31H_01915 [Nitrososphaerales archaeon]